MPSAHTLFMYFGLSFINVCMRLEFMTLVSCDSVCCMCGMGLEQSLIIIDDADDQRPTGLHACVRSNDKYFEHTLWLSILFSVFDELYLSHHG